MKFLELLIIGFRSLQSPQLGAANSSDVTDLTGQVMPQDGFGKRKTL